MDSQVSFEIGGGRGQTNVHAVVLSLPPVEGPCTYENRCPENFQGPWLPTPLPSSTPPLTIIWPWYYWMPITGHDSYNWMRCIYEYFTISVLQSNGTHMLMTHQFPIYAPGEYYVGVSNACFYCFKRGTIRHSTRRSPVVKTWLWKSIC